MQRDKKFYPRKEMPSLAFETGGFAYDTYGRSVLNATSEGPKHPGPFHGVDLEALDVCPKNFIIFDKADNKSRIMFHPALANKFSYRTFDNEGAVADKNVTVDCNIEASSSSSTFKEDTKDIDALLSLDEEDEEEVSTAGTMGNNYRCSSPEFTSVSSYKPWKAKPSIRKRNSPCSSVGSSCVSNADKKRVKELLLTLRGIVPGSDNMDNVAIIDEAVRYLKSLKAEVKKLGIIDFEIN